MCHWQAPLSTTSPVELAAALNASVLDLFAAFVSADGTGVDYRAMALAPEFANFVRMTATLQVIPDSSFVVALLLLTTGHVHHALATERAS